MTIATLKYVRKYPEYVDVVYLVSGPALIFEDRILQGSILIALAVASMYTVNRILNR